jgi:hypothetical protein
MTKQYFPLKSDQAARINFDEFVESCGKAAADSLDADYLRMEIDKSEILHMASSSWLGLRSVEDSDLFPIFPPDFDLNKKPLFICDEGSFIVDDEKEAEARWKDSWASGFIAARADKITKQMLKDAEKDIEKAEIDTRAHITVLPDTGHNDEHFIEAIKLDDESWAWKLNTPMGDSDWGVGDADDILVSVEENCHNWFLEY